MDVRQHTLDHLDCPACEESRRAAMLGGVHSQVPFADAAELWLGERHKLSEGARDCYRQYFRPLKAFFGKLPLSGIHIGHVREYQNLRQAEIRRFHELDPSEYRDSDGGSRINHELSALAQILRPIGLWREIHKFYRALPLPPDGVGMALSEEEEAYFFEVARSRSRWMVAYCCDLVSCNTTAGPKETRYLRLKNIRLDLPEPVIFVTEGTKNKRERIRPLPLNRDAVWALRYLVDRYKQKMHQAGIVPSGEHFVLFHRAHVAGAKPDPTRPMGSWKKAHYAMRAKVAERYPRLKHFRRYDFRHTAATKMLDDPRVSYSTIEKIMGHRAGI